jgi:predicted Zn-dependent protease
LSHIFANKYLVLAILIFFMTSPAGLLPTEKAYGFTVSEEREVGEKLLSIVRTEFDLLDEPDITQYITRIGREVLKEAGPQYFDYHFFMVKDKEVNAFAAPSGLIFLNSGLIELLESENEMAGVLAHEAGHIVSRHYANRIKKSTKANIATAAMILAGIAAGGGAVSEALITGGMAANASMNLKFSRDDEKESDQLAVKWMKDEGRDPEAIVEVLQELRRVSLYRSGNLPPYLLTHPEPEVRMGYVEDLLLFGAKGEYKKIDEFDFTRMKYRVLSLTKSPQVLISHFKEKMTADAKDSSALAMDKYGLALALQASAEYNAAEKYLQEVILQFPTHTILQTDLGVLYFESGRYAEALKILNRSWDQDRDNSYTAYHLARTLEQTGNIDRALQLYDELLAVQPDYSTLYYRLGSLYAQKGLKGEGYYYLGLYHWYEGDAKIATQNLNTALQGLKKENPFYEKTRTMIAKIDRLENIR